VSGVALLRRHTPAPDTAAIGTFRSELLSHGLGTGAIFAGCEAAPECALTQAYAGALHLSRMTADGFAQAAPYLDNAAALLRSDSPTGLRLTVSAFRAWHGLDHEGAILRLAAVVEDDPTDLVALKFAQILQLGSGDVAGMISLAAQAVAANPVAGHAAGMLAFALEQNGEVDRAELYARRALEINFALDPWAQHALAHIHAARGEFEAGRRSLLAGCGTWMRCSSFMRTHNWWHAALYMLAGDYGDLALYIYDTEVWGVRKDHCQDQVNAVSLLALCEIGGIAVGDRWIDLARHCAGRVDDGVSDFLDLHYVYALARAGEDRLAERLAGRLIHRLQAPAMHLAPAMLAHARGQYDLAAECFAAAEPRLAAIGGSNIQRQLFARLHRHAATRIPERNWLHA
jgi:tetratricopeptide (TPR) repeat protein